MARQLQRHPVRRTVIHVDFQVVSRDEVISAEVPILLVGEAVAVNKNDGTVDQEMTVVSVKAKPADLPPNLEVDISDLEIGDSIRAGDIELPPGVELDEDGDSPVVVAHAPRAVVEEAPAAAAEEAETPEADGEPSEVS
jgi:large subunit ribosomal protein L25